MPETLIIIDALPDGEVTVNGETMEPNDVADVIAKQLAVNPTELDNMITESKDHYDLAMIISGLASGVVAYDGHDLKLSTPEPKQADAADVVVDKDKAEISNTLIDINNHAREIFHLAKSLPGESVKVTSIKNSIMKDAQSIFTTTKMNY